MGIWKKIAVGFIFVISVVAVNGQDSESMAQRPAFNFVFDQIFDNREYFSEYAFPQTIFGARLDAEALFRVDSNHAVAAGINYMYENGGRILGITPTVDLYYQYKGPKLHMYFGSFQRRGVIDMPLYFLTDTLNYYRPNMEGASIDYTWEWGHVLSFIDWTGRVSETQRETFLVGIDGRMGSELLFVRPSFLMYHNARSYHPDDSIHLQDNGIMSVLIGTDLSKKTFLDELILSTGYLTSYNRFRPDPLLWGRGWVTNLTLGYNIFGIKGVYYNGTPIEFEYGDPFYSSGNYGRLDLFVDPFKNKKVKAKMGWNLHFTANEGLHHSQQILITVEF